MMINDSGLLFWATMYMQSIVLSRIYTGWSMKISRCRIISETYLIMLKPADGIRFFVLSD